MAVDNTHDPWVFDAVGQSAGRGGKITSIRAVAASAAGDFLVLQKLGGAEVFRTNAQVANTVSDAHGEWWVDGIYISALPTGGKVYVYYV